MNPHASRESSIKGVPQTKKEKSRKGEKDRCLSREVIVLKEALQHAETENETLKDRLLRTAAELDNTKKRTERESTQTILGANKRLILDLLPVVDDLERSLKTSSEQDYDPELFRQGIELIYQKFTGILRSNGLEPMDSLGKPFDVSKHDALMLVEDPETPSGVVVQEHEKGYTLHGSVLRHARVVISK